MTDSTSTTAPAVRADRAGQSATIGLLAAALAKAQALIKPAPKDKNNPFFNSMYADLASVWDAVRVPLASNGLAVIQTPLQTDGKTVVLRTVLAHESGEWISSVLVMSPGHVETRRDPQGNKTSEFVHDCSPQALGSCLTYARRYALSAIAGVCADDDDGNAASARNKEQDQTPPAKPKPAASKTATKPAAKAQVDFTKLEALIVERGITEEIQTAWLGYFKVASRDQFTQANVDAIIKRITTAKEQ